MNFLKSMFGVRSDCAHFSKEEVARHHSKDSLWIVAGSSVYDVTSLLNNHPGGKDALLRRGGGVKDCTQDLGFHSSKTQIEWQNYCIGEVLAKDGGKTDERGRAYLREKGSIPVEDLSSDDPRSKCDSRGGCLYHYIKPL